MLLVAVNESCISIPLKLPSPDSSKAFPKFDEITVMSPEFNVSSESSRQGIGKIRELGIAIEEVAFNLRSDELTDPLSKDRRL